MQTDGYYLCTREDTPKIVQLLTECFLEDPLFSKLFPKEDLRKKLLPDMFTCDVEEMLHYCDVLSESEELKGILILQDSTEKRKLSVQKNYERLYALKTDYVLLKNDLSMRSLFRYFAAHKFFLSRWSDEIKSEKKIHLIYFAVRRAFHGTGIAHKLMLPLLNYCDCNGVTITLETHNQTNLNIYYHYGFKLYDTLEGSFNIAQACMVREPELGRTITPVLLAKPEPVTE